MVYRLSPEQVRPPRRGGPSGALALLVVLGLAVGIWVAAGGQPGSRTGGTSSGDTTAVPSGDVPTVDPTSGLPYVAPSSLPAAALEVISRHDTGVAQRVGADGEPYDNDAGLLPAQPEGYYTVYPVTGSDVDPGDERLVGGEPTGAAATADAAGDGSGTEWYWTDDAGYSFFRVGP
ncbi:ribonuclease domain-containing protein [Nocardioides sp. GY 10127]|uniref:ribonuclease domain-containing protein n=1 Tax=Nocardioides sp. GY 10127 TaxID=2569762 RepID=UPI0010A8C803|nr:ribonuclease domain-containing protein [Nocardioides sp. GY 10127]TIC80957.1 hypothetical protein E8D37_14115 [Nocardioides sp. GY 10127]